MNTFLKGTFLLSAAAFIGECIEFFMNTVLAKELGEEGLGLYMSILPTVFFIVLLASFELPVAISKFISEQNEKYHRSMLNEAIRFTVWMTTIFLAIFILALRFVPIFHQYHPLFKWLVAILIPLVSFTAVARGFFMGKQQMGKIAIANLLRKVVQLLLLIIFFQFFNYNTETSILVAFFAFVGSEFVLFVFFTHMFYIQYRQLKHHFSHGEMSGKNIRRNLLAVSVPTTGLRLFHSFSNAVEPFLIKAALVKSGLTAGLATQQYGLLSGVSMTIGLFPIFIAHSLLTVLIPIVSKAYAQRDMKKLQHLLRQVIGITFLYGVPSVIVFYFFAEPLTDLFLHSAMAENYLKVMIPYFLLHFFVIPLQAYLIGLGLMKDALFHNVWSTIVSFLLMYVLCSSGMQMDGIIIGMNTGVVLLTLMHYLTICKKIGVSLFLTEMPLRN